MHHFASKVVCCIAKSLPEFDTVVQVLDSLITSLTKHTSLLNPAVPQASVAFGADELSCMATETMFELANRCVLQRLHHGSKHILVLMVIILPLVTP